MSVHQIYHIVLYMTLMNQVLIEKFDVFIKCQKNVKLNYQQCIINKFEE